MESWNGVGIILCHVEGPSDMNLYTDASGDWGCGAQFDKYWLQSTCP